ncbi:helix-turn-helix transcriptional regulator [uncultured Ferrovibrio sp.]|jgi:phage repressor protein C with HTH and peptisase S24 domain|uniref:S24 family peptidase n=1 Tax=uncultured Ferrovibrio sp. TaxID=1576913 RepID=UPI0026376381|nr:helix-turn-helix transcriptional regulator [uncultured Ferrovibrio sp.]
MLTHKAIWAAIDGLAERYGLTASGLARKAGLDPTTFNRSKRVSRDGKQRWPSTESISKVIEATGASVEEFMSFLVSNGASRPIARIPLIGLAQAGAAGYFDDAGFPTGEGWEKLPFPEMDDPQAYALEISGDSMLPVYRDGDVVIVSPAASIRRGDRVIAKTVQGEVMCKILARRTLTRVELTSFNPAHPDRSFDVHELAWMARIVWARQ